MKKRVCRVLAVTAILLVTVLLIGFAGALLTPKYQSSSKEGSLIAEYYREDAPHEVLFLGDCEVYECFIPPTLWEDYGITSYIRGSGQQLVWQSYYLLCEMLRHETPDAVVFNVYALRYGEPQNEAFNRMTLDGMKWSRDKISAIRASMTDGESFLSYFVPLLRFHSRWDELTGEDFRCLFRKDPVSHNGYLMQTGVMPAGDPVEPTPLADPDLPESSMQYLDRMRELCEKKGVTLILIKAPVNNWRYYWYDEWEAQVADYARENGLDYYNLIPLAEEIGLDFSTDTYDGGAHLNVSGAEKLTAYFGKILSERYGIRDLRTDAETAAVWKEKTDAYYKEKEDLTK